MPNKKITITMYPAGVEVDGLDRIGLPKEYAWFGVLHLAPNLLFFEHTCDPECFSVVMKRLLSHIGDL